MQNFNRWIRRGSVGNGDLRKASPEGFRHAHLETLPLAYSPRKAYDSARAKGEFPRDRPLELAGRWELPYEIDMARDLNGVGLLCFASYFAIADACLAKVWRRLDRSVDAFLRRVVIDHRLCFLGNADAGTPLVVKVARWTDAVMAKERFDLRLIEAATGRLLAVVALECLQDVESEREPDVQ